MTIHAAKGLEFKVVIVADAGRDRPAPAADEILALSDGRFGFKVADPYTSKRRGAFAYDEVRAAREAEDRAERLRLYYVAMTRAIDRLIVSGALDPEQADETPIGWVLRRVEPGDELARAAEAPVELQRGDARLVLRVERHDPVLIAEPEQVETEAPASANAALAVRRGGRRWGPRCPGAAGARAAARAAPVRRAQSLLQRDCALRTLLVPLLRRACRWHARAAAHRGVRR